jgi:iron(III) transport system ATP-binding protein
LTTGGSTLTRPAGKAGAAIPRALGFEAISHRYGVLDAVTEVSIAVKPGEIVCLLGPSGCGKSTLLRLAAGLERPTSGRVTIDGVEVAGPDRFVPPERRGVGLMFQDFALFPHLDILSNVMFGLDTLARRDAETVARAALDRVGLAAFAEDYPHTLSGGEQQRIALARAIAPRPGIFLMDEPFSGLDARLRDSVRDETLAVLRETRATAILVTHDPEEAMRIADRIVLMRLGRVAQVGTPEALYRAPVDLAAARFFTEVNQFEGFVENGAVMTPLGALTTPDIASGTAVDVAVRLTGVALDAPSGTLARVRSKRFLGEVELIELLLVGHDAPVVARVRGPSSLEINAETLVRLIPEEAFAFPAKR